MDSLLPLLVLPPGFLVSTDAYMNVQLANAEEYIDGNFAGALGEVLIRCNNVLYIRGVPEEEEEEEQEADGKADGNGNDGADVDMQS